MTPSLPNATELAHWTLAAQHPLTHQWCSDDQSRLARLADAHEFDLQLTTDLDLATQRSHLTPGHDPQELLNRWVAVSPKLSALLSIRFEGGDAAKPFVDASALSCPLTEGDLTALGAAAIHVFGSFGPRYLRLWSAAPTNAFTNTDRDKRFLAAPVRDLATKGRAAVPAELSLAATTNLTHWDEAAAAYAAVDAEFPGHSEQAQIQDVEDLQESMDAGTLFDMLVNQTWAGWVGATTETGSPRLGLAGYTVQEIILTPAFRGRGYGPHLTTLLARNLPDRDRVLVGTIHADNQGALEAAQRAGRYDVGGWLQISLEPSVSTLPS